MQCLRLAAWNHSKLRSVAVILLGLDGILVRCLLVDGSSAWALSSVLICNPTRVGGTLGGLSSAASCGIHSKLRSAAYTDNVTYCVVGNVGVVPVCLRTTPAVFFNEFSPRVCYAVARNPTSNAGTVGRLRSAASCASTVGSLHG